MDEVAITVGGERVNPAFSFDSFSINDSPDILESDENETLLKDADVMSMFSFPLSIVVVSILGKLFTIDASTVLRVDGEVEPVVGFTINVAIDDEASAGGVVIMDEGVNVEPLDTVKVADLRSGGRELDGDDEDEGVLT